MKNYIIKTVSITKWTYFSAIIAGLFFTSCEGLIQDIQEELQPVVDFIEDISEIQEGLEDAMALSEDALTITLADGSTGYLVGECAVVTHDENNQLLTIDMGTATCTGLNGMERSGKIVINYIDEEDPDAYSYSIDFQNYTIGGNTIEGLLTMNKLHRNDDGKLEFSEKVENAKITLSNGKWYSWNSERTREMKNGENTDNVNDDVFQIAGFFEGVDNEGNVFKSTTEVPITFLRTCWEQGIIYPAIGKTRIEMTGKPTTKIDWGVGCNKRVNILQQGNWLNVELR